jgi:arylsulfatase A-like enzyme
VKRLARLLPPGWWRWAIGIGLIAAAVANYFARDLRFEAEFLEVPLRPLRVSPGLQQADALPAEPGDLSGYSLLLVTLDTTRPDRLGCYGNGEIRTPILDALARDGVIFSNAFATAPTTLPAHASILTGLYPHRHGSRANGFYPLRAGETTLAELLSARGYATAAVVSTFILDSRFGLDQGFDVYDDESVEKNRWTRVSERRGDRSTDRALQWLRGERDEPWFLWVHYYDPHVVYEPPAPYAETYAGNPYDGEIAFDDAQLGRLLGALDELGLAEQTLVVVVGDHGESLGDHGELSHGILVHDATLRVPLIMRAGSRLDGGVHIRRRVSQVDLVPTILSLLGVPAPGRLDGIDLGRRDATHRPIFAETLHGLVNFGWAPLVAVYDGEHKYIQGPVPELYDLSEDPLERRNAYGQEPSLAASMRGALDRFFGSDLDAVLTPPAPTAVAPEDLARLQALGYALETAGDLPPPDSRPDPKQMLPVLNEVEALALESQRTPRRETIARLEEIGQEQPDYAPTFRLLARLHAERGELPEAEQASRQAIRLAPGDSSAVVVLAQTLMRSGETGEARVLLRDVVATDPGSFEASYSLGVLLLNEGSAGEAADHLVRAFEIDARDPRTLQPLVRAMRAAARQDELRDLLAARLAADASLAHVRSALTRLPPRRPTP